MKLTIIGGGGFRVPQIFTAISEPTAPARVDELCLYDVSPERLSAIRGVLDTLAERVGRPPRVTYTTDMDAAVTAADFVFSAMRVGGLEGRIADERVALDLGVLGQETVGPGGLSYALRTLPVARDLARRIAALAPDAWVINFTNPAGIVTEAMRAELGDRVVGICDTPIGLMRRAVHAAGGDAASVTFDYVGLNHLGWLRSITVDGAERLPDLLADDTALAGIEEARLMGFDWVRSLGALPNEYLFYYYFQREATARIRESTQTRGEFLLAQQADFYRDAAAMPVSALDAWERTKFEREASYMAESRPESERTSREASDIEGGGYQAVALALMAALTGSGTSTMILNVANRGAIPELPPDAVVELPCTVDADGIHPHSVAPVTGDMLGLMQSVKAAEQLTITASANRDAALAWRAFAVHPLVDSVATAKLLLERYREAIPGVDAALRT